MTDLKSPAVGGKVWNPYSAKPDRGSGSSSPRSFYFDFHIAGIVTLVISTLCFILFGYLGVIRDKFFAFNTITTTDTTFISSPDKTSNESTIIYLILALLCFIVAFVVLLLLLGDSLPSEILKYVSIVVVCVIPLFVFGLHELNKVATYVDIEAWVCETTGIPSGGGFIIANPKDGETIETTDSDGNVIFFTVKIDNETTTVTTVSDGLKK